LPPEAAPSSEVKALKAKLRDTLKEIRVHDSKLTVHDLKRLLFRCAATIISLEKVGQLIFLLRIKLIVD